MRDRARFLEARIFLISAINKFWNVFPDELSGQILMVRFLMFVANENVQFWFYHFKNIYLAVLAVGMWETQAAFWPEFSKPLREATLFVAFRGGVISTASLG